MVVARWRSISTYSRDGSVMQGRFVVLHYVIRALVPLDTTPAWYIDLSMCACSTCGHAFGQMRQREKGNVARSTGFFEEGDAWHETWPDPQRIGRSRE